MVLPALTKAREQALSIICKNNLHQMGLGLQIYIDQNNHNFPKYSQIPNGGAGFNGLIYDSNKWNALLVPYDKMPLTNAASQCPIYARNHGVFDGEPVFRSYAINATGTGTGFEGGPEMRLGISPPAGIPYAPIRESQVVMPSEMFAIGDTREFFVPAGLAQYFLYLKRTEFSFGFDYLSPFINNDVEIQSSAALTNEFAPPHAQGYNVLHVDGHVAQVTRRNIYYLPVAAPHWNNDHQPHPETWLPKDQWAVQQ